MVENKNNGNNGNNELDISKALTTQAIQISLISLIIPIHLTRTALTIRMATKISVMIYRLKTSL